ncbi:MAG: Integral rane protein TerC, partial [Deltaproteobacteria bacterium]|nr:Integral rane protein TerC [Deltaproteobacteria bacterium]
VMGMFRYLKFGLCFVLSFVGVKMLISDFYKIPIAVSLGIVGGILAASIFASLVIPASDNPAGEQHADESALPPGGPTGPDANGKDSEHRAA